MTAQEALINLRKAMDALNEQMNDLHDKHGELYGAIEAEISASLTAGESWRVAADGLSYEAGAVADGRWAIQVDTGDLTFPQRSVGVVVYQMGEITDLWLWQRIAL